MVDGEVNLDTNYTNFSRIIGVNRRRGDADRPSQALSWVTSLMVKPLPHIQGEPVAPSPAILVAQKLFVNSVDAMIHGPFLTPFRVLWLAWRVQICFFGENFGRFNRLHISTSTLLDTFHSSRSMSSMDGHDFIISPDFLAETTRREAS